MVVLPQINAAFHGQGDQLAAGLLIETGVCRVRNILFHHGRVDADTGQAVIVDGTGFAPRLDGLGQQPFHPFLADPHGDHRTSEDEPIST